ncbi:hypothetical protein [Parapedobacter sp. DT-150]|uniref:hypothetical protein n=1 Tax=Parapedobacter sp. DT-150 TaxID=3396162 RepID=UPI003F19F5CE
MDKDSDLFVASRNWGFGFYASQGLPSPSRSLPSPGRSLPSPPGGVRSIAAKATSFCLIKSWAKIKAVEATLQPVCKAFTARIAAASLPQSACLLPNRTVSAHALLLAAAASSKAGPAPTVISYGLRPSTVRRNSAYRSICRLGQLRVAG